MSGVVVRVAEVTEETPIIRTLRLVHEDERPFTPFSAGAHVDITGPTGVLRQYSLCSAPGDPSSLLVAIKREPEGAGSSALHRVEPGDRLLIGKPRNLLGIAEDAEQHILVAGGIGVTPLLSMAYELYSRGAVFELHYFARSRDEAAFVDLLEERAEFRDRVHLHFGTERAARPQLFARIISDATDSAGATEKTHVYTCGPVGFMEQLGAVVEPALGERNFHVEHFEGVDIDTSGDTAFTVELDTGEEFEIPADQTILSVLEENGIDVFKSCEEGVCGSCVSGLIEGVADHRDNCLSKADKEAGGEIALCVSRAKSPRLVIELY
ncbi:oxidoreductase [Leucobacter sp. CSA1]|uniref:Oxidoreductase n=1 Tax=Leucobacter chromiisoli TaxID=2796471 RepID=A0A934QA06_9MICO|nr:PDR/VanB family oxidoreductase [Leucobacter chromiisoli]MBK0420025.1 oxidoreductase [Leucobacter chromiisoli]